jgi:signal transduction histidine kinase
LPVRRLHDLHVAHDVGQPVSFRAIRAISKRKKLKVALLDAIAHERRRLGDDLHDGLGQELTGLSLLLSAIVCSIGLRTMRYRASLLGSKLQIKRLNPVGTRIVCETRNAADSEPTGAPVINPWE